MPLSLRAIGVLGYCTVEEYFCGARDLAVSRSLNPSLQTFDLWLAENKSRL